MFRSKRNGFPANEIPTIIINSPSDEFKMSETALNEENDEEDDESAECNRLVSLRRNSISLPNLDDMQIINDQVERAEHDNLEDIQESSSDLTNANKPPEIGFRNQIELHNHIGKVYIQPVEMEKTIGLRFLDEEFCDEKTIPLRNARRKSVTYPRMLRATGDEESSPANSITSNNSLASLLREKMQMFPSTIKKKKSPDYKIRIFVGFLLITIIFLVSFAYALYHQKVLQRAYFERIKFNHVKRAMKIFNDEGVEIIKAKLGVTLNFDAVHPCLPKDQIEDNICLEWMQRARLYLNSNELNQDVKCYNLRWVALGDNGELTDCFEFSINEHWYGGGQNAESAWQLEKGNHEFSPFITGTVDKHEWGNVLKRYFINSKGAAIIIDNVTPLHTSITGGAGKKLCLKAQYNQFAYVNHVTYTPQLNYSICVSSNTLTLHSNLIENTLWDGLKQEDLNVINSLLTEPLWEITGPGLLTEDTIINYTEEVILLGFLKQGHVLINEFWQKQVGDFTVDVDRFPKLDEVINVMHRRGFRIVFSIQPYISTESSNFAEAVKKRLLVSERFSDRRIPALTRYKSLESAGVLDPTNNRTMPWLLEKLKNVTGKYKFDAFYLDVGVAYDLPHYYQCDKPLINPDHYKTLLTDSLQDNINLFGVNSAVVRPKAPIFVSLPQFESSWNGLRRVIPTILSYGLLGYPFLIPGAVGGDFKTMNVSNGNDTTDLLPDKELYMRWMQLATFLPVIRFTRLPSTYGDQGVLEMAKISTSLRQMKVSPLLKKYARIALDTGLPMVRPLWMMDSNDTSCHSVVDEFSIGDDLIVAPVLYSGSRQREVYLPAGVWKDGIDGSFRKGSRWIHNYKVEEDQVAYFEKMPDNTRL